MASKDYDIAGIDLSDDRYTVVQSLIRSKYDVLDADGNTVLNGKQKRFRMKEQFPFVDADGNEVFSVKAANIIDVAGDYLLTDSRTGEDLVVLDNDYSLFRDTWTIRDADTRSKLAEIKSRGALMILLREKLPFGEWIPPKYEITDADGAHVGTIRGQFSLRDRYEITIDDASTAPKEPIVAAAIVIDAIQGH
ncbi:LURP-one-related/scramblase family protein [Halalkalicoccus ordinarius]|uniref:LURP-one-related/scramblase family protein n=1 Tax=Halalkalicoccus ordinarius TaxID=3116651 RepID=UPI00300F6880